MRSTTTLCLLGGLLALLTVGCGSDDDTATGGTGDAGTEPADPGSGAEGLVGRTFLSESVTDGGQPRELVEGTAITVSFPEDGRISFSAGCNGMGSTVEVEADRLVLGDIEATAMGCDDALHEQDTWVAELIGAEPTYTLDGDRLRLESDGVVVELVDEEVADPDRPLEGTTWQLTGMITGAGPDSATSSSPVGTVATITVENGTVTLTNEGCNGGTGPAEVAAIGDGDGATGTITFDGIALTRMGCPDPQSTVEAALTTVLDGEISYEIDAGALTLTHTSGQGLTFESVE